MFLPNTRLLFPPTPTAPVRLEERRAQCFIAFGAVTVPEPALVKGVSMEIGIRGMERQAR
jgi:hypothetical protein